MKKYYILIISCMMIVSMLDAQVAITTDGSLPDGKAMLDVQSTTKGMLIPRMTTAQRIAIGVAADGLVVYDNDLGAFCFFRSGGWKVLFDDSQGWSLTGNSAVNPDIHFLGTTDTARLMFRVNNNRAGTISSSGLTLFGYEAGKINNGTSNTFIGFQSGLYNMTGNWNTALGYVSFQANVTGSSNTALGVYALKTNTEGSNNIAVGHQALNLNETGNDNTAAGFLALARNTSGGNNTGIGASALYNNFTGYYNTAVGNGANVTSSDLNNTTALGYNAWATASNQVRLGNSNITSLFCKGAYVATSVLPTNMVVDVNGQIMRSTASMPSGSGGNGQVTFWTGSVSQSGSNNLFWDNTNGRLGIGTSIPGNKLTVQDGNIALTSTTPSADELQFYEPGPVSPYYTAIKAQHQLGNITYSLPSLAATTDGQVLSSTTSGTLYWNSAEPPLTFLNGLTRSTNTIKLGGPLTENTTITQDGSESFTISNMATGNTAFNLSNTGDFQILDRGTPFFTATNGGRVGIGTTAPNQQLEITGSLRLPADANGVNGVIFKGDLPFVHDYKPVSNDGKNTFVGISAGNFTMTSPTSYEASYNTGVGYLSLHDLSTGAQNTAVGNLSLSSATTGNLNTAMGSKALFENLTGDHNTAIGFSALYFNTSGNNTAIGSGALLYNSTGSANVAVGMGAGYGPTNGYYNAILGYNAGQGSALFSYSRNCIFGYQAGRFLTTGSNNILIGYQAGDALTSGANNIIIGYDIDAPSATGHNQLVLGAADFFYGDLAAKKIGIGTTNPGQKLTVDGTIGILEGGASPVNHTIFQGGTQPADITYTLPVDDGTTGQVLTSDGSGVLSWSSVGSVTGTGTATRVAFWNGASSLGSSASLFWDNTNSRLGIGTATPNQQLELTGNLRLPSTTSTAGIIYAGANPFIHNYGNANNFMGQYCGNLTLAGAEYNSALGDSTLYNLTSGDRNIAIGQGALKSVTTSVGNIAIGYGAGRSIVAASGYNTIVGYQAGILNNTDRNTFLGCETGYANTTGHFSVFVGHQAGNKNTVANNCVAIGYRALFNQTGELGMLDLNNVAVGFEALYSNNPSNLINGHENVAVGSGALRANTTGYENTSIGFESSIANTTGNYNTVYGAYAFNANEIGYGNTAIGRASLANNISGCNNTVIGIGSFANHTTGSQNTGLGCNVNVGAGNLTNVTVIGYGAFAALNNQVQLGNGDVTSLYCDGAYAGTVGVTNRPLYADVTGKIGYIASSARYKDDILDMESSDWLFQLRPVNFTYKTDVLKKKQYGLIAEEVEKINPDFVSYNKEGVVETVSYNQLISPMIKAMQEQQKTISALQSQVEELRKDREAMLSRLEAIEKGEQGLTRK